MANRASDNGEVGPENLCHLAAAGSQAPSDAGLAGKRVLIVEDLDLLRGSIARQLRTLACIPAVCESAEEAVGEVLRHPHGYDVVLSDVHMPRMSGWQLLQTLRDEVGDGLPVVLSSGQPLQRPDGCPHTPDATLAKPYRREDLARVLRSVLQSGDSADPHGR